jgi:hypothetical protein
MDGTRSCFLFCSRFDGLKTNAFLVGVPAGIGFSGRRRWVGCRLGVGIDLMEGHGHVAAGLDNELQNSEVRTPGRRRGWSVLILGRSHDIKAV